ncbi:MAG: helix-turn-helix domain-containing protein [Planctomycetaceae bacterium]|nr:helix-turn-helix domain-containing protein [Planctomycetaceae bacterium]
MTEEELLSLFRRNMRLLREELGISQSELARRIGRKPGYICDMERGRRAPNLATLALIAEGLGLNPSVLISTALRKK